METAFVSQAEWASVIEAIASSSSLPEHRRHELRHVMNFGLAILTYDDPSTGRPHRDTGVAVIDLSLTGMMLRARHDLPRHTPIEIDLDLWEWRGYLRGEVAHCTQSLSGYKLGIELNFGGD